VPRVLIVDDEPTLLRALAMNFTARGYDVREASTGTTALSAAARDHPDLIVLDLGLPDVSGADVIRAVRAYATIPIIVLSARIGSRDKVEALDLGADDYVTKPFSMQELLARARAVTRRVEPAPDAPDTIQIGHVTIDLGATTAIEPDGTRVHLTPTEWHLLAALLRQPGRLVTSRTLLTELRGAPEHTDPSYLRIFISQLRRKLEPEPGRPQHLLTEPGMGYRFQP
jgi:two-component system, OmpR family, KDP operon response regulator KdpE